MKIKLLIGKDGNSLDTHRLFIDDKEWENIQDLSDCPEDAHIGRDLIDGNDIIKYIKLGYEACKNGEEIEIKYGREEDYE